MGKWIGRWGRGYFRENYNENCRISLLVNLMSNQTMISTQPNMTEIIFLVEDDPEGGYVAQAMGASIFTQADTLQELRVLVKDAVHCHYPDETLRPKLIRLHIVHDEVIAS